MTKSASPNAEAPVEALKAIAHPLRFRILAALAQGERNVGEIEEISAISQPALSQQLAILRKANLVTTRRDAKQVYYSIDRVMVDHIRQAIGALLPDEAAAPAMPKPKKMTGAAVFARLGS